MLAQLLACYRLPTFSPARAARSTVAQLGQLVADAGASLDPDTGLGDLLLQIRALLAGSAPILIDVADRARALGVDLTPGSDLTTITPFAFPRLATGHDTGEDRTALAGIVPDPSLSAGPLL